MAAVSKILREHDKLEQEEEEVLTRLLKIRRQKKVLRSRGAEMASRGFESLDELEADDRRREEARQGASDAFGVIDWSTVDLSLLEPVGQGSSSGTVGQDSGSVGGA
jgi:hypothetical protein